MAGTRVTQTRRPITIDTGTKYQIAAQCTLAGTLPDTGLFVFQVNQVSDPKNDVFQRLAEVVDFTTYGTSRNSAITAGTTYYRTASFTQNYDDVVSANGAWKELSSRLNTLVNGYDAYINEFLTPEDGAEVIYPAVDEGVKNNLITAYLETLPLVTAAVEARDQEQVDCNSKELELTTLQTRLQDTQDDLARLTPIKAAVDALVPNYSGSVAQITTSNNAVRVLNEGSTASAAEISSIRAQVVAIDGGIATQTGANISLINDVQTPLGALIGDLQARASDLVQQTNGKQLEVNECHLALASAQAAVDQARINRDQALAAVRAVCPDYVP